MWLSGATGVPGCQPVYMPTHTGHGKPPTCRQADGTTWGPHHHLTHTHKVVHIQLPNLVPLSRKDQQDQTSSLVSLTKTQAWARPAHTHSQTHWHLYSGLGRAIPPPPFAHPSPSMRLCSNPTISRGLPGPPYCSTLTPAPLCP